MCQKSFLKSVLRPDTVTARAATLTCRAFEQPSTFNGYDPVRLHWFTRYC